MSILIHCPQCGRELKLPDRSLLGRKGKCPKCQHSFVLKEAAEPASIPPASTPVPPPSQVSVQPPIPSTELPIASTSEQQLRPVPDPTDFFARPPELSVGTAARLKELQRQRRQKANFGLAIAAVIILLASGIGFVAMRMGGTKPNLQSKATTAEPNRSQDSTSDSVTDGQAEIDPTTTEYAVMGSPTRGKPIDLKMIPFGTQVVIHFHPATLWKPGSHGQELGQCIPPMTKWIEDCLQEWFFCSPESIEEVTLCLIPGLRGAPPEVAAVARMTDEKTLGSLTDRLGAPVAEGDRPISVLKTHAYMVVDSQTMAMCPVGQVDEMIQAIERAHPIEELDPLLKLTDNDRQFTVILTPVTFGLHDAWFPANLRPLLRTSLTWLGENVETLGFSFHLTDELFYSEILLRNKKLTSKKLEQQFQQRLSQLAENLVPVIQQMSPDHTGKRMLIGRLPAMIEVFSMATFARSGSHHVQLITPLPERAAPNLLLGGFLAWDESTRTTFSKIKEPSNELPPNSTTVSERLKAKIDVDFRATPFNEAFAYLSAEINTPIELNGDALKAGGFTKNLKQTFQMQASRVQDVIARIFEESKSVDENPQKKLVIVIDESRKSILVTTLAAASEQGLTAFEFK